MPIYEYELLEGSCPDCPGQFEARQRIHDAALPACPRCHKAVQRLISKVAIHTPVTASRLKDLGMTRLKRLESGVYQAEGANSNVVDMSADLDTPTPSSSFSDDNIPEIDISEQLKDMDMGDVNWDALAADAPQPKPASEPDPADFQTSSGGKKQLRKTAAPKLPYYDLISGS